MRSVGSSCFVERLDLEDALKNFLLYNFISLQQLYNRERMIRV